MSFFSSIPKSMGDLVNLLPTATVLIFQVLNPILTNNSHCAVANRVLTAVLLVSCAFSCAFSCFTDSYIGVDGKVYYGLVTVAGLLPFADPNSGGLDFSKYRLRFADFVYAFFSVLVFAAVSLMDPNSVGCFFPGWDSKAASMALPSVIGFVASVLAMVFPISRHGIGFAPSPATLKANDPPPQA